MIERILNSIGTLRQFSIFLILGVVTSLLWANLAPEGYQHFLHTEIIGNATFHWLVNDIYMVFFFAFAAVEITKSLLPGGDLNPINRAINPIISTLGGVLGPVAVYLVMNYFIGIPDFNKGWGIPTATDIALAWVIARLIFGAYHPAVRFLLLLAIVDDGIGLAIIAIFYPDPLHPVVPIWLLLVLGGMLAAFLLRKAKVKSYWPYILIGGSMSWAGLFLTHLHPALALVFIIPFLPHETDETKQISGNDNEYTTLRKFKKDWKVFVEVGLFAFGLANAGVQFSAIGTLTWLVLSALLLGKTGGIFIAGYISSKLGFPLPKGMKHKDLFVAGIVAAMGLTVALFVAGVAFTDLTLQGGAKMGALGSIVAIVFAFIAEKILRIERVTVLDLKHRK